MSLSLESTSRPISLNCATVNPRALTALVLWSRNSVSALLALSPFFLPARSTAASRTRLRPSVTARAAAYRSYFCSSSWKMEGILFISFIFESPFLSSLDLMAVADFRTFFFFIFFIFLPFGGTAALVVAPLSFFLVSPPPRWIFCNGSGSADLTVSCVTDGLRLMNENLRTGLPAVLGEAMAEWEAKRANVKMMAAIADVLLDRRAWT